jgi:Helix-turn-helix
LTQDDLAGLAEIDRRYVQRIEAGTPNPGIDLIFRVREALCASWDEMLRGLSKSSDDGDQHLIRRQVNSDTQRARVSQFLCQSTLRREGTGTTCRSCNFKLGHYRRTDLDFFTPEHAEQALADEREMIRTGEPIVGKVEKCQDMAGTGETRGFRFLCLRRKRLSDESPRLTSVIAITT